MKCAPGPPGWQLDESAEGPDPFRQGGEAGGKICLRSVEKLAFASRGPLHHSSTRLLIATPRSSRASLEYICLFCGRAGSFA